MNVKQVIEGIAKKEHTIKSIAEQYGVSDRTVQKRIKSLGYVWDAKEKCYVYNGNESEAELFERDFVELLGVNKQKPLEKQLESNSEPEDVIDMLLQSSGARDKVYRGYYIDKDVLDVIERAGSGNKSELVNECLRKVFREKGLL